MSKTETSNATVSLELTAKEHVVLINEIKTMRYENALMKQLSTDVGFCTIYFKKVLRTKEKKQAFYFTNDLYKRLYGCTRFSSFNDFSALISKIYGNY